MLAAEVYWTHLPYLGIPSLLLPGKPSWGFIVLHSLRDYTCLMYSVQPFLRLIEVLWPLLTSASSVVHYCTGCHFKIHFHGLLADLLG
jgi:hypothetical protein